MASNIVFTAEKTEISEQESFSIKRTGWSTWDASLPWETISDCIMTLSAAFSAAGGTTTRGSTYQVRNAAGNYRPQSFLQWLDTDGSEYVLMLHTDELPLLASVLSDLADFEGLPVDLDVSHMTWRNFVGNTYRALYSQDPSGPKSIIEEAVDVTVESMKGSGDGLASLDEGGKLPETQVPDRLSEAELSAAIAQKIGSRINVWDFGILPDGEDHSSEWDDLMDLWLTLSPRPAPGGTAYNPPEIYFPSGSYQLASSGSWNLKPSATHTGDQRRLVIVGDGDGNTLLNLTHGDGWEFYGGLITIRDLRFRGSGTNKILSLGRYAPSQMIMQSDFERVHFYSFGTAIETRRFYDSKFSDVLFVGMQTTGAAIDMIEDSTNEDCTNNITFIRTHWENATGATVPGGGAWIRGRGGLARAAQHGRLFFYGCHIETRRYDVHGFDLERCNNVYWEGQMLQSQTGTVAAPGDAVSLIRLVDVRGFGLRGGIVSRDSTSGSYAKKLISVGGMVANFTATNTLFTPNSGALNESLNSLWQSDPTTPYTGDSKVPIQFIGGVSVGVDDEASLSTVLAVTGENSRNVRWGMRVAEETSGDLAMYYTDNKTWFGSSLPQLRVTRDGVVSPRRGLKGLDTTTTANGVTKSFDLQVTGNAGTAMLLIVTNTSAAILFSAGTSLTVMNADPAHWAVGNTDPGTADVSNVFIDNGTLKIANRTGSVRRYSVVPVNLHAGT